LAKSEDPLEFDAWSTLRGIGKPAVAGLLNLLKDDNEKIRARAAETLGQIGEPAKDAIPLLSEMIKSDDKNVRAAAAVALYRLERRADRVLPVLEEMLKNEETELDAIHALGDLGPAARKFAPELMDFVQKGRVDYVRSSACRALGEIGPLANTAVPVLI